jgi:hypothetical protein
VSVAASGIGVAVGDAGTTVGGWGTGGAVATGGIGVVVGASGSQPAARALRTIKKKFLVKSLDMVSSCEVFYAQTHLGSFLDSVILASENYRAPARKS